MEDVLCHAFGATGDMEDVAYFFGGSAREPNDGVINRPGRWHYFLSHTQRDGQAVTVADEIFFGMKEKRRRCWLDVKMVKCDVAAMEEGVRNSDCLIAIVTDNGTDSYFSRWSESRLVRACFDLLC